MTFIIMCIMLIMSIMLTLLSHPITMSIILLTQTLLISLETGFLMQNFWFSYILFLIMVGGMLVLFIYMTSIASNEKFKFSINITIITIFLSLIMTKIYTLMDNSMISVNIYNFNENSSFNIMLNKFLNYPSSIILFMLIIYLFITLIAVAKISHVKYGPLRQTF